jgi:hypothetical protein
VPGLEARVLIRGHLLAHRRAALDLDAARRHRPRELAVMGDQPLWVLLVEAPLVLGDDRADLAPVGVTVGQRSAR